MADRPEVEVVQDVVVLDVAVDRLRSTVTADLYGGPSNVCGTVRFRLGDLAACDRAAGVLERWRRHATPLTLVSRGSTVSLQDEQALFADIAGPDGGP